MNIFYLDPDPQVCAEMHNDKHCVKMIIEYAQLMSTAHRLLDGKQYTDLTANGRRIQRWRLEGGNENVMMKASHINHPSGVWTRANDQNYLWLYRMWLCLCKEYTYRYGKIHAVEKRMSDALQVPPKNIPKGDFYGPTPAMPDDAKVPGDSLASYRKYYNQNKTHLANWKKRPVPSWYSAI